MFLYIIYLILQTYFGVLCHTELTEFSVNWSIQGIVYLSILIMAADKNHSIKLLLFLLCYCSSYFVS